MKETLVQLYPEHRSYTKQRGLFLAENLHKHKGGLTYACFLSSLDGRIAIRRDDIEVLPESLGNSRDLCFFFELEAQADCIITNGSYLRARAAGRLDDILHIGRQKGDYSYLAQWRQDEGLDAQPLVVVCNLSLIHI